MTKDSMELILTGYLDEFGYLFEEDFETMTSETELLNLVIEDLKDSGFLNEFFAKQDSLDSLEYPDEEHFRRGICLSKLGRRKYFNQLEMNQKELENYILKSSKEN